MEYEYECSHCGKLTTVECKISEMTKTVKCECGKRAKQILSSPSIYYEGNFHSLRNDRFIKGDVTVSTKRR